MLYDYPADKFIPNLVGKTIASVRQAENADEGLKLQFTDGSELYFGFSGCEGSIYYFTADEVNKHA